IRHAANPQIWNRPSRGPAKLVDAAVIDVRDGRRRYAHRVGKGREKPWTCARWQLDGASLAFGWFAKRQVEHGLQLPVVVVVRSANRRDDRLGLLAVDRRSDDLERMIALGLCLEGGFRLFDRVFIGLGHQPDQSSLGPASLV